MIVSPKMKCPRCGQLVERGLDGHPRPHGRQEGLAQVECHPPLGAMSAALSAALGKGKTP